MSACPRGHDARTDEDRSARQRVVGAARPRHRAALAERSRDKLQFAWIAVAGEAPLEWLAVERGAYDEIATDADGDWAELRADLGGGAAYVDMNRLIIAAAPA